MPERASTWRVAAAALLLAAAGGAVFFALRTEVAPPPASDEPTFSRDIAPLVFARCAECHREGGAGPFELLSYDDVRDRAPQIRDAVVDRFMPPWKPVGKRDVFMHDRSLTDDEIALLTRWIDGGMPIGDAARVPPAPTFPDGWQLGKPDLVVELDEPYPLGPDGRDIYKNLVIPAVVDGPRFVRAWEFRPRGRAVHHAILNIDRTGEARARDAAEPGRGYGSMSPGNVQSPGGFYVVWTPGKAPTQFATSWLLDQHTDLVLQLHMQPTGKPERVSPAIGLYFTDRPPERRRISVRFGDKDIDIPAGDRSWSFRDSFPIHADVRVASMFPHAHYIAKKVTAWAALPGGGRLDLLRIDDWDFNWQDEYTFVEPPRVPKGSTLFIELVYDNSADNIRNPNSPPKRVRFGEQSTDEMGNITFSLEPVRLKDLDVLAEAKFRRSIAIGGGARAHFNLANALSRQGRAKEAIAQYEAAIEAAPDMAVAHFNLGTLHLSQGHGDEAIASLEAAIEAKTPNPGARTNLGKALEARGDRAAAIAAYRKALEEDEKFFAARASLARALALSGDRKGAIENFTKAAGLRPDSAVVHRDLGDLLREEGRLDDALNHYRRALALAPDLVGVKKAIADLR